MATGIERFRVHRGKCLDKLSYLACLGGLVSGRSRFILLRGRVIFRVFAQREAEDLGPFSYGGQT